MSTRAVPFIPVQSVPAVGLPANINGREVSLISVLSCAVEFPVPHFAEALNDIVLHPEYNSSIILRAEVIRDDDLDTTPATASVASFSPVRNLRRKILPRRPDRDGSLEQDCIFYVSSPDGEHDEDGVPNLVLLIPQTSTPDELPFYHPKVAAIAFQHSNTAGGFCLSVHILPLSDTDASFRDISSRLYRICVSLAESIWKIGFGKMIGYKKRIQHDMIIDRNEYQDFYLVMRERFKSIVETWQLDTDPLKHVYEDIGIATFIILLWKHTYPNTDPPVDSVESEPWHSWGRPPGGYVDLGCGNGLLVHILVSMGYIDGLGIDLRSRITWTSYSPLTQSRLVATALDPTTFSPSSILPSYLPKPNGFIIGNHSDELTPWVPLLAQLTSSGFLSIPCCPFTLDSTKFTKPKGFMARQSKAPAEDELTSRLEATGRGGSESLYAMYLQWHLAQAIECGFEPEVEVLRIPTTRNWAIIGRRRVAGREEEYTKKVHEMIDQVRERGIFRTRIPEGKAEKH